jgi:hypothetical protein
MPTTGPAGPDEILLRWKPGGRQAVEPFAQSEPQPAAPALGVTANHRHQAWQGAGADELTAAGRPKAAPVAVVWLLSDDGSRISQRREGSCSGSKLISPDVTAQWEELNAQESRFARQGRLERAGATTRARPRM